MGQVFFAQQQYDSAIASFKRVTQQNSAYYFTWGFLGLAYSSSGQYQNAVQAFSLAIKQYPDNGSLYYNRGVAKGKLSAGSDFCDDFRKAMELGDANGKAMWEKYCK
jgi:tetratricopeptide (TPR) repeat protein